MNILLEGFAQGAISGTWRVLDGGAAPPASSALAIDNGDGTVTLPKTGHRVPIAVLGEGIFYYYIRVAGSIGGEAGKAGALQLSADTYNIGRTGSPVLDMAVQVDAYANPGSYGLGGPGAPGVAAPPAGLPSGPIVPPPNTGPIDNGAMHLYGITNWIASNPEQIQFVRAVDSGYMNAVCENAMPVWCTVSDEPVTSFPFPQDLAVTRYGSQTTDPILVPAGKCFNYLHLGTEPNRMRCSMPRAA